ncbi:MAG: enoyl-CoA hydratase/isomerase family protein [Pseudomonadota bacterium]|nr:enoyl-CoA hydratase/isomerase family protein [Pseudomonadota bacterium]
MRQDNDFIKYGFLGTTLGKIAVICLNRPKVHHSLNLDMVSSLAFRLGEWERDPQIKMVFIHSETEAAFCAGGDVKEVRQSILESKSNSASFSKVKDFFLYEYFTNYLLRTYKKPVVTWAQGITMGAGLGLFLSGHYRILSPPAILSMPEVFIGFFCDVGASYFLNQVPYPMGHYLGLTGSRLNATDALKLHMTDYTILYSKKKEVLNKLLKANTREDIQSALYSFHMKPKEKGIVLPIEEKKMGNAAAPLSVAVVKKLLDLGKTSTLEEAFAREWHLAIEFSNRHDFPEGVRALLVDKDKKPQWQGVATESEEYFKGSDEANLLSKLIEQRRENLRYV